MLKRNIIRMYYSVYNNIHRPKLDLAGVCWWWWWQQLGLGSFSLFFLLWTCYFFFFWMCFIFFYSFFFASSWQCVNGSYQSAYCFSFVDDAIKCEHTDPTCCSFTRSPNVCHRKHLVTSIKRSKYRVATRLVPYQTSNYDNLIIISMRCCTNNAEFVRTLNTKKKKCILKLIELSST